MAFDQIVVELQDSMGTDRVIAEAAWTSTIDEVRKKARSIKDVDRVVKFLIRESHTSPLEQVFFRFHIRMPIFVSRQFLRYRMMSPNEMSGRYRTLPSEFYGVPDDVLSIVSKFADEDMYKQDYDAVFDAEYRFYKFWLDMAKKAERSGVISNEEYKRFREVDRAVLGTGFFTEVVVSMNLHSLQNVLRQRLAHDSQREHQDMALKMLKEVIKRGNVPIALYEIAKERGFVEKYFQAIHELKCETSPNETFKVDVFDTGFSRE